MLTQIKPTNLNGTPAQSSPKGKGILFSIETQTLTGCVFVMLMAVGPKTHAHIYYIRLLYQLNETENASVTTLKSVTNFGQCVRPSENPLLFLSMRVK